MKTKSYSKRKRQDEYVRGRERLDCWLSENGISSLDFIGGKRDRLDRKQKNAARGDGKGKLNRITAREIRY